MSPRRRRWLALLACAPWCRAHAEGIARSKALVFPRDHGAHPDARTEWWYVTGWLGTEAQPAQGFQITFFRSRTGLAEHIESRFAARQLLFAHAALTVLDGARHLPDQRIVRWSGAGDAALGAAALDHGAVRIGDWSLRDTGEGWEARVQADGFGLGVALARTQPLLLQGDAGLSRKGPQERQASRYYSEPQLRVAGRVQLAGAAQAVSGRAWLDHEWSDEFLHPDAVGWDWIGINLFDGAALTAFVLRRADGSALWAGGSFRAAGRAVRAYAPDEVAFIAGRVWRSPTSGARYPTTWQVRTPSGTWTVRALADAQELDSRASTGTIYWEGLSEVLDGGGRRVGLGYLEMTGYAGALKLG